MHSPVRTDESHENVRLENAQKIQGKKKAQARRIVTGLNALGVGRWEFGKSSCHSNHTQNNGFIMRLPTLKKKNGVILMYKHMNLVFYSGSSQRC
jgi:hypothetical protein